MSMLNFAYASSLKLWHLLRQAAKVCFISYMGQASNLAIWGSPRWSANTLVPCSLWGHSELSHENIYSVGKNREIQLSKCWKFCFFRQIPNSQREKTNKKDRIQMSCPNIGSLVFVGIIEHRQNDRSDINSSFYRVVQTLENDQFVLHKLAYIWFRNRNKPFLSSERTILL